MANYLFQKLEIGDLFISANCILKEGSSLEFILEKISEEEAVYRDDKGKIRITVKIPLIYHIVICNISILYCKVNGSIIPLLFWRYIGL